MKVSTIKDIKIYFSTKEREKRFRNELEAVEEYKERLQKKDILYLKKEKIKIETNMCNKKSFSEYIFQIISIGLSILILIVSIGYYILNDSTSIIGYTDYINQKYNFFSKANKNIININSSIVKDNDLEKNKEYLELSQLLFNFTMNSNTNAMDICSNEDAYRQYNKSFDDMLIKIDDNLKWKKYRDEIYRSKEYITDMGNINKDFVIYKAKTISIEKFFCFIFFSFWGLFLVFILMIYILRIYDEICLKNSYIIRKKFEYINQLINLSTNDDKKDDKLTIFAKEPIEVIIRKKESNLIHKIINTFLK